MKRRGFFGALFGAAAIPLAAKAGEFTEAIEESLQPVIEEAPGPQPMLASMENDYATCMVSCGAGVGVYWGTPEFIERLRRT